MAPTIIRITRVGMATWWRRRAGFAIGRGEGGAAGLVQPWLKDPALLLLAGEGARRADEGARAQRRVLLTLAGGPGTTAKAATFGRPPHPALRAPFSRRRAKGCFHSAGGRGAAFFQQPGRGTLIFRRGEMGLPW